MTKQALLQSVGERICFLRKEKGIKAETMAKALGISRAAYSNIENELVDCKASSFQEISSFLKTEVGTLFGVDNFYLEKHDVLIEEHRCEISKLNRVIGILVSRNEYLNEQIELLLNKEYLVAK